MVNTIEYYGKPRRAVNNAAEIFKLAAGKFACGYNAYANGKTNKKSQYNDDNKSAGAYCGGRILAQNTPDEN